jgi:hypothetical protein
MSDRGRPEEDETFSPEELGRLDSWQVPGPPPGFSARVVSTARGRQSAAPGTGGRSRVTAPLSRAERDRRRRRRSAAAALLGAVAVSAGGGFIAWQAGGAAAPAASHALTVYLAALAFGGVLLLASLVGGHDHADHHGGAQAHGHGQDDQHGAESDSASHVALVLPFLSLRFWIFGLAFFGLTGAVLHGFGLAGPIATAIIASGLGLAMGYGAAQVFQSLARPTGATSAARASCSCPRPAASAARCGWWRTVWPSTCSPRRMTRHRCRRARRC